MKIIAIFLSFLLLSASETLASGRSVFDTLFLKSDQGQTEYDIPFPFSKVIDVLEQQLGMSINNDANIAQTALIPLGRCINRYAAAPDFFKYPRIVVAIDSEHYGSGKWEKPFIKDQIFLGYQEKANAIEVISYNEEEGRFDFQMVSNYSAGNTPSVKKIKDDRCTSCHQNNGPIFPRSNWDETELNDQIFKLIGEAQYGPGYQVSRSTGSGAPSIDQATNRANMFSLFQKVWQDGCRSNDPFSDTRCRAGLLQMALEHRLQENNRTIIPSKLVTEYVIPLTMENSRLHWPDGILIPSSDINNQNPISLGEKPHLTSALSLKQPMSFMIKWHPQNIYRIVQGLGGFIPLTTIRRLDDTLFNTPLRTASSRINFRGTCRMRRTDKTKNFNDKSRRSGSISVRCDLTEGALSSGVSLYGDFYIESGLVKSILPLSNMYLESSNFVVGISHRGGRIEDGNGKSSIRLKLFDSRHQLHARLPSGAIVDGLEISWNTKPPTDILFNSGNVVVANITLTAVADSGLLDAAIERLIAQADHGRSALFADKPFSGTKMLDALFRELPELK